MANIKLPGFLKKKKLLDDPQLPAAACRTYGDQFFEADWLADALDFYLKGNDTQGLARLQARAVETGDAFLLERLSQVQGGQATELWEQVAVQASALGKFTLAAWAREKCGPAVSSQTGAAGSDHAHDA